MPAAPPHRPPMLSRVTAPTLLGDDPSIGRVLGQAVAAISHLNDGSFNSRVVVLDLAVGTNRIDHGLGRRARIAAVAPTVADAAFAWSFTTDNDTQAIITIVGVDQPGAAVEIK